MISEYDKKRILACTAYQVVNEGKLGEVVVEVCQNRLLQNGAMRACRTKKYNAPHLSLSTDTASLELSAEVLQTHLEVKCQ